MFLKSLPIYRKRPVAESLFSASACNFIKKETLVQVFSCEFCEIFKNTYFEEHLRTTASGFMFFVFLKPYSYNSTTTSNHNIMTCMQGHFTQSITLSWIRYSVKKVFLELSQNLQKNTCASLFFQPGGKDPWKRLWQSCFPLNFVKFLRTPFLTELLPRLLLKIIKMNKKRTKNPWR